MICDAVFVFVVEVFVGVVVVDAPSPPLCADSGAWFSCWAKYLLRIYIDYTTAVQKVTDFR